MQLFLQAFFNKIMKRPVWIAVFTLAVLIHISTWFPAFIEEYYTFGIYPFISKAQRFLLGWIPFSIGDLFYAFLSIVLIVKVFQLIRAITRKRFSTHYVWTGLKQLAFFILLVYVSFQLLWGLNYSREGIANQLHLEVRPYSAEELHELTGALREKLNFYAGKVDSSKRQALNKNANLFSRSDAAYAAAAIEYPFLEYAHRSLKPSLFTWLGHFFGFSGYYNPFSGEGQVRTNIPLFQRPFVATHEIAHQLGYGKENEANFVSFLACRNFDDDDFRYAIYYDMFSYALHNLSQIGDTSLVKEHLNDLHTRVHLDRQEMLRFHLRYRNPVEPLVSSVYDSYLRLNQQPKGIRTYNEVVAWLVAFYRKRGGV